MIGLLFSLAGAIQVEVARPSCWPDWFDGAALERMLEVESSPAGDARVSLRVERCARRPLWFEIVVVRPGGGSRRQQVSVDESPEPLRLRALALIINEQVRFAPETPVDEPGRTIWRAGAAARLPLDLSAPLYGAEVGILAAPLERLALALAVNFEIGRAGTELGTVESGLLSLRAAPMLELGGPSRFRVGPELELGWALARPVRASTGGAREAPIDGGLASVGLRVEVELALGAGFRLALVPAAGTTWGGVRPAADGEPAGGAAGPYLRAGLTLGWE